MAEREWLETDGLGGYASGTARLLRTRRQHSLLTVATRPPRGRINLVAGFDAELATPGGRWPISEQWYTPGLAHPGGSRWLERFDPEPWPRWFFRTPDGTRLLQELFMVRGAPITVLAFRLLEVGTSAHVFVRPFIAGRSHHALHTENSVLEFAPSREGRAWVFRPYPSVPGIRLLSGGEYLHDPEWYRRFEYSDDAGRGLDHREDLASPGVVALELTHHEACVILAADGGAPELQAVLAGDPEDAVELLRRREIARRASFSSALHRAADAYLVEGERGPTIIAGYPWLEDLDRDTVAAVRGLAIATGRLDEAEEILLAWARSSAAGPSPSGTPRDGGRPEHAAVDPALWFVIAAAELDRARAVAGRPAPPGAREALARAVEDVLIGHLRGAWRGVRLGADGLLAAGEPRGPPVTWMDAVAGDGVVTPRDGKAVELQALWLNALDAARRFSDHFVAIAERGTRAFEARFWDGANRRLFDVVDARGVPGSNDASLRPNQLLAAGGLPLALVHGERARLLVAEVEAKLLTPLGLRTLDPPDRAYLGRNEGTVWPWLLGPFAEAWAHAHGGSEAAKREARRRFLTPFFARLREQGVSHVFEVAGGDPPHTPGGCPFRAWSLGELIRADHALSGAAGPWDGPALD